MKAFKIAAAVVLIVGIIGCSRRSKMNTYAYAQAAEPTYATAWSEPLPSYQAPAALPDPSDWPSADQDYAADQGVTVLTRGAVHEAFAEPIAADSQLVVATQPPPAIHEVPPDEMPQGDNIAWIPGYWSWDSDLADFVWVSGFWRDVPPGMRWTPGYWCAVDGGFAWVPGFWSAVPAENLVYLPQPPAVADYESLPAAPSDDVIWSGGCWVYAPQRYTWRPGHWMACRADYLWVPAHYVRTPRGYIFVEGYWDYPIERRGLLFAPVCMDRRVYSRPRFVYSPAIVIDINILSANLFVRPHDSHYVFGDYYDRKCLDRGVYPLVDFARRRKSPDPIFAHEQWRHRRDDPQWGDRQQTRYEQLRDNKLPRPAGTYAAQVEQLKRNPGLAPSAAIARPLRDVASNKTAAVQVAKITPVTREKLLKQSQDLAKVQIKRVQQEVKPPRPKDVAGGKPVMAKMQAPAVNAPKNMVQVAQPPAPKQVQGTASLPPTRTPAIPVDARRADAKPVATPVTAGGKLKTTDVKPVPVMTARQPKPTYVKPAPIRQPSAVPGAAGQTVIRNPEAHSPPLAVDPPKPPVPAPGTQRHNGAKPLPSAAVKTRPAPAASVAPIAPSLPNAGPSPKNGPPVAKLPSAANTPPAPKAPLTPVVPSMPKLVPSPAANPPAKVSPPVIAPPRPAMPTPDPQIAKPVPTPAVQARPAPAVSQVAPPASKAPPPVVSAPPPAPKAAPVIPQAAPPAAKAAPLAVSTPKAAPPVVSAQPPARPAPAPVVSAPPSPPRSAPSAAPASAGPTRDASSASPTDGKTKDKRNK
ncbi:MAG: hypothetical protein ACE15C_15835 [Phycisphaerae bacterium]